MAREQARSRGSEDQSGAERLADGFGFRVDVQLVVDVPAVSEPAVSVVVRGNGSDDELSMPGSRDGFARESAAVISDSTSGRARSAAESGLMKRVWFPEP